MSSVAMSPTAEPLGTMSTPLRDMGSGSSVEDAIPRSNPGPEITVRGVLFIICLR